MSEQATNAQSPFAEPGAGLPGPAWTSARRVFLALAVFWSLAVAIAAVLSRYYDQEESRQVARLRASEVNRAHYAFHLENVQSGGIYTRVSPQVQPDPLLAHVTNRDLVTASGERLTLYTPTHFPPPTATASDETGWRVHPVSNRPLCPDNTPDDWETQALQRLAKGEEVISEVAEREGHTVLRFLQAWRAQPGCLSCHTDPALRVGEVCGGLSVAVPLASTPAAERTHMWSQFGGLTVLWLLGLLGLHRGSAEVRRRVQDREDLHRQIISSSHRLRALAEQAPVGIYEADGRGKLTYANRRWLAMMGLAGEAGNLALSAWFQRIHPEDRAKIEAAWQARGSAGKDWELDYRLLQPDGATAWIHDSAVVLWDAGGRITGFLGVATDLTELRRMGAAIKDREERFRLAFDASPMGIVLTDVEGRFSQVNPAFAAMLGYATEELHGKHVNEVTHPDDRSPSTDFLRRVETGAGAAQTIEKRYTRKDGAVVWARVTAAILKSQDGQPIGKLAMVQDFTERRESEARLREQATLIEIAQDAICVLSLSGTIEFWNPAAEKLYGWPRAEAVGQDGEKLLFGLVSRELLQARTDVLTHGFWSGELQLRTGKGKTIQVSSRFSLVRDAAGQPKSMLIVSTDLTEKKQLEKQFLRVQRMESIGTLASGVAHDLNNVFSPILMVSELLAAQSPTGADAELLKLLRNSAERGAGIVRQLLGFSRGQEIERTELHLQPQLKEFKRLMQETFPRNITVTLTIAPDLRLVLGDVTQIHQLLLNLCVNARDAMPKGGVISLSARNFDVDRIFCEMNPDAQLGPHVVLEVADTGTGIPATIKDKIFDPFFTTKPPGQGTGLGLATVLGIVKSHRGFLDLQSEVGEGTRFRVFLPAIESPVQPPSPAEPVPATPLQSGYVLVVDDEEAIRSVARAVLERHGYQTLLAEDGVEAVILFSRHQADIRYVLTDILMPGMDGVSFIKAIRKLDATVPIVAMSGLMKPQFKADLAGLDPLVFLEKPFTGETIVQAFLAFPAPQGNLPLG